MNTIDTSELLERMTEASEAVGTFVRERPIPAPAATMGEFREVFGALDDEAARILRPYLDAIDPTIPWLDELDGELPDTGRGWVVDTVDGAVQYLQGLSPWCVSITLLEEGEAVAVVLHNPNLRETYAAAPGAGAFRNGVALQPSAKSELRASVVATSQPPFTLLTAQDAVDAGTSLAAVLPAVGAVRNLGPTSWQVADVAAGRIDGFWEFGSDSGNLAGAALIAREAGVVVTDSSGADWTLASRSFVAGPPALHAPLLALVASTVVAARIA